MNKDARKLAHVMLDDDSTEKDMDLRIDEEKGSAGVSLIA